MAGEVNEADALTDMTVLFEGVAESRRHLPAKDRSKLSAERFLGSVENRSRITFFKRLLHMWFSFRYSTLCSHYSACGARRGRKEGSGAGFEYKLTRPDGGVSCF